ncbi:HD domain-containing protein [Cohnella sp. CFH 77786]|uniref:HD-GYP domain-containing protein n=1 Tax=Cohnella sp. CFH 77786 TaxID=2662265 RepID=UPI001C60880B|nr:HD-GYP domain-containing protein [Cohnella sp. CFH 77786]MBW5447784.1 HD domain-containing protein [Cohnella sp. CFH 77786]
MRVHVTDLQPGDRLSQDTFTGFGLLVLSKGAVLNEHAVSRLYLHRIEYVEIEPRFSDTLLSPIESDLINPLLRPMYQEAVTGIENIFGKALEEGKVHEEDLKESFQPLVDNFKAERDVVSLLLLLNSQDDYTYQHSVQVGMLSYYIARWLGWDETHSVHAGKAGFLHDIGKCRIPDAILNKPGKLSREEYAEIQNHSKYGYEILENSFNDRVLSLAALQHHERMDGTGYPNRLSGESIHPVSKIVAVADTYSAMISSRVYQEKRDLLVVLKELHRVSFRELDPEVTFTFIRHMIPNFIGKKVELSGGVTGTIVMNHPTDFFHPLIRTGNEFIDLSVDPRYEILQVYL